MEIDIRNQVENKVNKIRFWDDDGEECFAVLITKSYNSVFIGEESASGDMVLISCKEHAENLIKALEKAIELQWLR